MNQIFFVVGATLCYVGGFGAMIFLLGVLTELCIEIWDGKLRKICDRLKVEPEDVIYLARHRDEIKTMLKKQVLRWPEIDIDSPGQWRCITCKAVNQYDKNSESVAYCRCCGQATDMDYYRRAVDDSDIEL